MSSTKSRHHSDYLIDFQTLEQNQPDIFFEMLEEWSYAHLKAP